MSDTLVPWPANAGEGVSAPCHPNAGLDARAGGTDAEHEALATVWRALWRSRVLIWAAGCLAVAALDMATSNAKRFDATGISTSLGTVGNVLAAPAVRGDAIWYLRIAHQGYYTAAATRFFPLYPALVRASSWLTRSPTLAGVLISMMALLAALLILHRLTALELGARAANATVELVAFAPLALFFSAVYSEALFLAFSAGTFCAARRGRWAWAGALGGLAALTRVTGMLLAVPVLILFLYGPRADAEPDASRRGFAPRYRLTPTLLWAALIPGGTVLFSAYLAVRGYGPLSFLHAQSQFTDHVFELPFVTVWDGVASAWQQLRLGFTGFDTPSQSVVGLLALAAALLALRSVFRRLPLAYGMFIVVGLLVPLASPTVGDPLKGLARYVTVLFPVYMVAGAWALERGVRRPLLLASAALLILFTAQFATWHVVGSQLL
ncbi:MAG TPA: mannosyltransferase family protein [Solirubrobacteraceae bacterium]|nr:mannosyltransferase family protein [Solirubrobacteraceae bacterium]